MLFATVGQGALFVWMMLAGVVIGAWYALMALLRRILRAGLLLTLACDLLFGAGAAAVFLAFLVSGNYGQVRPYLVLAAVLGALLFAAAFAVPLERMVCALERACRAIVSFIAKNRRIKVIFK